jgi:hypothetical protein
LKQEVGTEATVVRDKDDVASNLKAVRVKHAGLGLGAFGHFHSSFVIIHEDIAFNLLSRQNHVYHKSGRDDNINSGLYRAPGAGLSQRHFVIPRTSQAIGLSLALTLSKRR